MKNIFTISFILFVQFLFAQDWEKTYFATDNLIGFGASETYDGGVLTICYENNDNITGGKLVLIKTDLNGNDLFRKSIGLDNQRFIANVIETINQEYILYGEAGNLEYRYSFMMKLNSCFEKEWIRFYSNDETDYSYVKDVIISEENEIYSLINYLGDERVTITKQDQEGNIVWQKSHLPNGFDADLGRNYGNTTARNIQITKDKGLILGGIIYIEDFDIGEHVLKSFVLKLDSNGNREWLYAFGVDSGYVNETSYPIELADSSILVLCNYRHFPGVNSLASYCYKLDNQGNLLWHKLIDSVGQSNMDAVLLNDTTIYLLTSIDNAPDIIDFEGRFRVLKIDTTGVLLDSATYAEDKYSTFATTIDKTSNQKMIISGAQYDNDITSAYLLKIQQDLSIDTFSTAVLNYDYLCSEPIMNGHIAFDTALSIINIGNVEYELKVYPNPSQSYVCFEIEADKSLEYSLNIYDALGGLVYSQKEVKDKLLKVNVLDLSSGVYYYSIMHQDELGGSGRFVKE